MAALNIPLITWCIIVAAMTVLITVRLFHKNYHPVPSHIHTGHMLEVVSEYDEYNVADDIVSNRDEAMNDVDH